MNIEIAPEEYFVKFSTPQSAEFYCWSLVIDNKKGWRMPNRGEAEYSFHSWNTSHLTNDHKWSIEIPVVPVRDVVVK
jgi:hypothetical protein